jgi:hypothetical protein
MPFGIFCGHFGIEGGHLVFFPVLVCCTKKSGNPGAESEVFAD